MLLVKAKCGTRETADVSYLSSLQEEVETFTSKWKVSDVVSLSQTKETSRKEYVVDVFVFSAAHSELFVRKVESKQVKLGQSPDPWVHEGKSLTYYDRI